jgi:hypothetical protein
VKRSPRGARGPSWWTDSDGQGGPDGVSRGPASALPGALVWKVGNTDATIGLVGAAEIPVCVLVDLGGGEARAGARLGAAILRWLAVGRARPERVEKFQPELEEVLAFFAFPAQWHPRLRTNELGEGGLKHLRRSLRRMAGCRNAEHSEQV